MLGFLKKNVFYILIAAAFYVLPPFLLKNTGSAMILLLILFPVLTLAISFFHAAKNGFQWYFSVFVALIWLPLIFIYYNDSAAIYAGAYGILSFIGQGLAKIK